MIRRALLAFCFAASLTPAFAQAPPPIPALPDSERRTTYTITATTCVCAVGFQIYGDNNDVDSWIQVWVNGTRYLSTDPTFGWSLSSATGPLLTIPRPIIDAVLTFNSSQTGTVQIVGAQRPRRLTTFSESQGVTARSFNQALNSVFSELREAWDKINDATGRGLFTQPGNVMKPLPPPASCANLLLGFGPDGLTPACVVGAPAVLFTNAPDQVLTGGANVVTLSLGTGNVTIDCGLRPLQKITNGGAFTITKPANDGSCVLLVTNNASAGAITFSGFSVGTNTGDALTTTNTSAFSVFIWEINGVAGYRIAAHQ